MKQGERQSLFLFENNVDEAASENDELERNAERGLNGFETGIGLQILT